MQRASEAIRRLFLVVLLAFAPVAAAMPSAAAARHASTRRRRGPSSMKRIYSRRSARRSSARSRPLARSAYVLAAARIPNRHFAAVATSFSPRTLSPGLNSGQDEQRIPRQISPKTGALQGIVRDRAARGIVGAVIALTNRATGFTRTVSANADGVFRWTDLPPGIYLLLAQCDGYESLARDGLLLNAGDVVTLELTLSPAAISAAAVSRLPRMPELGPPSGAGEVGTVAAPYRELRRRSDSEPGQEIVTAQILPPSQEVFLATPNRWNVDMPEWNRYGRGGEYP